MQESRRASIHKVAAVANVSAMTVTRTFNGGPVAEKTKDKILKVASELGYRPNLMAKSLRSGKTNNIGLLCGLGGPHDSTGLARDISTRLMDKGYACHVVDSLADSRIIKQCLLDFCSRNIDGLIIELKKDLSENKDICNLLRETPNVVVISPEELDNEFDTLILDHTQAIRDIVDHFAAIGRKKIVFLTPADNIREQAFIEQIKLHNLSCDNNSIIYFDDYWDKNVVGQKKWNCFVDMLKDKFGQQIPFDALICSTDEGAAAVINYLYDMGCKVPDDVAVSGYNDNDIAAFFRPPLASVDRRNQDVAECATRMLFNRIEQENLPLQHELIKMEFVDRKSAG